MTQLARIGAARIRIAQEFAVQSGSWRVAGTTAPDDGPATDRTFGTVTGYLRQITRSLPNPAGDGFVTATEWQWYGAISARTVLQTAQASGVYTMTSGAYTLQVQTPLDTTHGICELRGLDRV